MSIKVSIIVPVYNAEKYLVSCVNSLLSQTLQECEFIFINDGSKDRSKQIIEGFMEADSRIKLYSQHNQGVSMARNKGLQLAIGEYVGFVDADDEVEPDMYERLYGEAKRSRSDLVISNFESEMNGHKVVTSYEFPKGITLEKDFIKERILPYFLQKENLNTVCNKLYSREIIVNHSISFPKGVALGEDGWFNIEFSSYASTVIYMDYTGYHYREVAGSATRNIGEKDYFRRAVEVYQMKVPDIYESMMDKESIQQLKSFKLIYQVMSYIHVYYTPSKELSFGKRVKYIKNMLSHVSVREALPIFYVEKYASLGRYERFMVEMMKRKSMLGLYLTTAYSRFRNQ